MYNRAPIEQEDGCSLYYVCKDLPAKSLTKHNGKNESKIHNSAAGVSHELGKSQGALAICLKQLGTVQKDSFGGINSDTIKRDCKHFHVKKNHESVPLSLTEIF